MNQEKKTNGMKGWTSEIRDRDWELWEQLPAGIESGLTTVIYILHDPFPILQHSLYILRNTYHMFQPDKVII